MSKFKFHALISAVLLISVVFSGLVGLSQSPHPTVRLTTDPPISQVLPFEAEADTPLGSHKPTSPTSLQLQAVDAVGKPLENTKIHLQILTPPRNIWLTTDFPIVEGTKLLDLEANAPQGKLVVQQTLPIRGRYELLVNVTPLQVGAFAPFEQTITFNLPENPLKYKYFGILVVILLIVGFGGGWVIGGSQAIQPGEIAPSRVRLLLSGAIIVAIAALIFINVNAEMAESHMSHMSEPAPKTDNSGIGESQGLKAQFSGDTSATVGIPAKLQLQVTDTTTNQPATDVLFNIKATQLEENWVAFAYQATPDSAGQLKWLSEFFDGAPHSVEVQVSPQPNAIRQFQPFKVKKEIEVEAVSPPLSVRFIGLAYFTIFVIIGLLIGMRVRQLRGQREART